MLTMRLVYTCFGRILEARTIALRPIDNNVSVH